MAAYITDFILVSVCVIGFTALNGIITNGMAERWFSGKKHSDIFDHSARIQSGWKQVGGKDPS